MLAKPVKMHWSDHHEITEHMLIVCSLEKLIKANNLLCHIDVSTRWVNALKLFWHWKAVHGRGERKFVNLLPHRCQGGSEATSVRFVAIIMLSLSLFDHYREKFWGLQIPTRQSFFGYQFEGQTLSIFSFGGWEMSKSTSCTSCGATDMRKGLFPPFFAQNLLT